MGVWPGLDERPETAHTARDWLAELHRVAAGCGLTTVPAALAAAHRVSASSRCAAGPRNSGACFRRGCPIRRRTRSHAWQPPCARRPSTGTHRLRRRRSRRRPEAGESPDR